MATYNMFYAIIIPSQRLCIRDLEFVTAVYFIL